MTAPVSKRRDDRRARPAGRATNRQNSAVKLQKREDRADAEIDAAGNQAERHAERDEAEFGEQPHQRQRVGERAVILDGEREIDRERDHHRERDDRLEPLLQQQFGQEQPRRPRMSQAAAPDGSAPATQLSTSASTPRQRSAPAVTAGAAVSCDGGTSRWLVRRRRGRRLRHRVAVGAAGVALIEPDRPRVELLVLACRASSPPSQQGLGGDEGVVTLFGRGVAQELVEVPLRRPGRNRAASLRRRRRPSPGRSCRRCGSPAPRPTA